MLLIKFIWISFLMFLYAISLIVGGFCLLCLEIIKEVLRIK